MPIHVRSGYKEFFERFEIIGSSDENLTMAHVCWIESRLKRLAPGKKGGGG